MYASIIMLLKIGIGIHTLQVIYNIIALNIIFSESTNVLFKYDLVFKLKHHRNYIGTNDQQLVVWESSSIFA